MQETATHHSARELRTRWWLICAVGFIVAHAIFGFIGHGFTGPHEGRPLILASLNVLEPDLSPATAIISEYMGTESSASTQRDSAGNHLTSGRRR